MKYIFYSLVLILISTISCSKNNLKQKIAAKDSLRVVNNRIEVSLGEVLIPTAKKAVSNWIEYKDVDDFITQFYNITTSEALSNAKELSDLVKLMKDSIRVKQLKIPSVVARFNVLENESLRLADMATIPSIKSAEVKEELTSILTVFSAINSKINTIYKASAIQKSLDVDTEKPVKEKAKLIKPSLRKIYKPNRKTPIKRKAFLRKKPFLKKE